MRDWRRRSERILNVTFLVSSLLACLLSGCGSDAQDVVLDNALSMDMTTSHITDAGSESVQDMTIDFQSDVRSADASHTVDVTSVDMGSSESPDLGDDNLPDLRVGITHDMWAESDLSVGVGSDMGSESDLSIGTETNLRTNPDRNGDNQINILVLGSSASISGGQAFSPQPVAAELRNILHGTTDLMVNVLAEDIHQTKPVTLGLGQNGAEYTYTHHSHSLAQYYYWPEGQQARWSMLSGNGELVWDHVVIGADPHIVSTLPGYYALGANKVAAKVSEGGAQPWLLDVWSHDGSIDSVLDIMESNTRRIAHGASVDLQPIPAGAAWRTLPLAQRDLDNANPSTKGAYVAAATIYASLTSESAAASTYTYDDGLASMALDAVLDWRVPHTMPDAGDLVSPFSPCHIADELISYNHTGTSSERGILNGLNWVFNQAPQTLQNGGESPVDFNYGRANSNFEANKRYQVDPARFNFSVGFPMQDHGNRGNESMLYGLDRRDSGTLNDTDLGVALHMVYQSELPFARAVPIRTLYAQMREVLPEQSAYRDRWHMNGDLDKSSGAFLYTLLTNDCVLGAEPMNQDSGEWRSWTAQRIGYETAWMLMHLIAAPPCE